MPPAAAIGFQKINLAQLAFEGSDFVFDQESRGLEGGGSFLSSCQFAVYHTNVLERLVHCLSAHQPRPMPFLYLGITCSENTNQPSQLDGYGKSHNFHTSNTKDRSSSHVTSLKAHISTTCRLVTPTGKGFGRSLRWMEDSYVCHGFISAVALALLTRR